jgi:RNA polymerase sigma-70 factor (ECF subfamily)
MREPVREPVQSDEAALALAARERRDAFLMLYDRYVQRIERYCLARTGQPSEAEDLVSATFLRALESIWSFDPERGTFASWLFTIARNLITDHHRSRRRREGLLSRLIPTATSQDPEEAAVQHEWTARLHALTAGLTEEQQEVLALRYGADLPYADVAPLLGRSEVAARKLVQRAVAELRLQLAEEDKP